MDDIARRLGITKLLSRPDTWIFTSLVVASFAVGTVVGGGHRGVAVGGVPLVVQYYLVALSIGLLVYSAVRPTKETVDEWLRIITVTEIIALTSASMVFFPEYEVLAWLFVGAVIVTATVKARGDFVSLEGLVAKMYALFATTVIVLSLGNMAFLQFAEPVLEVRQIAGLVDLRVVVSVLWVVVLGAYSLREALGGPKPRYDSELMPKPSYPEDEPKGFYEGALRVIEVTVAVLLRGVITCINQIWKLCVITAKYISRILAKVAERAVRQFLDKETAWTVADVIASVVWLVLIPHMTRWASGPLIEYLNRDVGVLDLPVEASAEVLVILIFLVGVCLLSLGLLWVWFRGESMRDTITWMGLAFAGIMMAIVVAGYALYAIQRASLIDLHAFSHLGLLSTLILGVLAYKVLDELRSYVNI